MGKPKTHAFSFAGKDLAFSSESLEPIPLSEDKGRYYLTSLALDVSGRCNLRCAYCAERSTQPIRAFMTEEVLLRAVNVLFEWSFSDSHVSVHLGSGEPLMEPDLVRKLGMIMRELAGRRNRNYSLHLTTNAVLMEAKIIEELIVAEWEIKVSLDGGAATHDRFRVDEKGKGTFQRVAEVVEELSERIPGRLSTTSVLVHGVDFSDVFRTVLEMGVKRFEFVPVALPISSSWLLDADDITNYREFLSDYAQRLRDDEMLPRLNSFIKRVHRVMGYRNARIPCGAGRNFLGVDSHGDLFPCFRFSGVQNFRLGHIGIGTNAESVQWFTSHGGRTYERRPSCMGCWAAVLCGGPCFAVTELMGYKDSALLPGYCEMIKAESEAAIWLVETLKESNPQRLVELLGLKFSGR